MDNNKVGTFETFLEDYKSNEIEDYTIDGRCSSCGACCTRILPLSIKEINRIKKYVEKNGIKCYHHISYPVANNETVLDMICPFRDSDNNCCTIYEVRPDICRRFICNGNTYSILKYKEDVLKIKNQYDMWELYREVKRNE